MSDDLFRAACRRAVELVHASNPELQINETQVKEYVNSAKDTVTLKLANRGLARLRQETTIVVPAGTTTLNTGSTPALPDIIAPIRVWERVGDSTWAEVRQVIDHIPVNFTPGPSLMWWWWRNNSLVFGGSTASVTIRIHYVARQTNFEMPGDTLDFPDLVNPLAFIAASLALGDSPGLEARANKELDLISSIDNHVQQARPIRLKRRRSGTRRI